MLGVEGGPVSSTDIAQNAYVSSSQELAQTLMPQRGTLVTDVAGNSPFCATFHALQYQRSDDRSGRYWEPTTPRVATRSTTGAYDVASRRPAARPCSGAQGRQRYEKAPTMGLVTFSLSMVVRGP